MCLMQKKKKKRQRKEFQFVYDEKKNEGSKIKCLTFGGGGSGRRQVEFTESRFQKKMDRNGIIAIGHCWALRLIQESG